MADSGAGSEDLDKGNKQLSDDDSDTEEEPEESRPSMGRAKRSSWRTSIPGVVKRAGASVAEDSGSARDRSSATAELAEIYGSSEKTVNFREDKHDNDDDKGMTENPIRASSRSKSILQMQNIVHANDDFDSNVSLEHSELRYSHRSIMKIDDDLKGTSTVIAQVCQDLQHGKFFRLCYTITSWHIYWIVYSSIILIEPFLISHNPYNYPNIWTTQEVLIVFSFGLFAIQYFGSLYLVKKMLQEEREGHVTHWEMWKSYQLSPPFYLEIACFACGGIFVWQFPGIASLRCFRFLRIFWYYDLPEPILGPVKKFFAYFASMETVDLALKVMEFASRTLESMGQEMFYLSKKTRGGFILVFIMFYSAYILGAVLYISTERGSQDGLETTEEASTFCYSLPSCTYIMVRLTFFDGDAFNFVYTLVTNHPILFCVVCVYFFLTAIGITNGLIGVFGDIFKEASNATFANNTEFMPILSRLTRIESVLLGMDATNVDELFDEQELAREKAMDHNVNPDTIDLDQLTTRLQEEGDEIVVSQYTPEKVAENNTITRLENRLSSMETMLAMILAKMPNDGKGPVM